MGLVSFGGSGVVHVGMLGASDLLISCGTKRSGRRGERRTKGRVPNDKAGNPGKEGEKWQMLHMRRTTVLTVAVGRHSIKVVELK